MKTNQRTSNRTEANMDHDLHKLFLDELADMYHAERQLTKALPKMIKAAESEDLRSALESHLSETENQVSRLEEVFGSLDEKPRSKPCKGMQGIVEEGESMIKEQKGTPAVDATLIAAGQKVEHYEIASYGTLVAWAERMGHAEAARLLKESLDEEKAADETLTEIAMSLANERAEHSN